jgi:hypothetical protein
VCTQDTSDALAQKEAAMKQISYLYSMLDETFSFVTHAAFSKKFEARYNRFYAIGLAEFERFSEAASDYLFVTGKEGRRKNNHDTHCMHAMLQEPLPYPQRSPKKCNTCLNSTKIV